MILKDPFYIFVVGFVFGSSLTFLVFLHEEAR